MERRTAMNATTCRTLDKYRNTCTSKIQRCISERSFDYDLFLDQWHCEPVKKFSRLTKNSPTSRADGRKQIDLAQAGSHAKHAFTKLAYQSGPPTRGRRIKRRGRSHRQTRAIQEKLAPILEPTRKVFGRHRDGDVVSLRVRAPCPCRNSRARRDGVRCRQRAAA